MRGNNIYLRSNNSFLRSTDSDRKQNNILVMGWGQWFFIIKGRKIYG